VFLDRFSKYHNVKSIYRFGFLSSPGISDLDFIIVLDDPLTEPKEGLSYKGFSATQKYIFTNTPPIYLNEELFKKYPYVLPFQGLELLHGMDINQIVPENKKASALLITAEICTLFYPRVFLRLLFASKFDIRRALLILNALKYPMKMIAEYTSMDGSWRDFLDHMHSLRQEWFQVNNDRYNRLISLVIDAVYISMDIIEKTANFLMSSGYIKNCDISNGSVVGKFRGGYYIFANDFHKEQSIDTILNKYEKACRPRRFVSILPSSFLVPLLQYQEQNGPISNHLKSNLRINNSFQPEFTLKEEARKRIDVLNSLIKFLENNNVSPNGSHIYYRYWPRVGLYSRLIHYGLKLGVL